MSLESLLQESATARAGYGLVSFKEAAYPVYLLSARIIVLERKALNPIEEGCLRAVDAGLQTPSDIRSFLGLQDVVLNTVLASLNSQETINYSRAVSEADALVTLTDKGRKAISESSLVSPCERLVKLVFDPLLRRVAFHQQSTLWKPRDVKAAGRFEVPMCGAKRPEVDDVPLEDIDRALERLKRHDEESSELLALRCIERRELLFIPCTLLFYRANVGTDVQVAFSLDDGLSIEHENAFRDLDGPAQIGARQVLAENPALSAPLSARHPSVTGASRLPGESERAGEAQGQIPAPSPTLRSIRCHEHPPLMQEALTASVERLLIISPWITEQVVTRQFVMALETLLRSGVAVYIGYGLEESGNPRDRNKKPIAPLAQTSLEDLQSKHKSFSFRFIGNTHRKVLVSDKKFAITTSFNWLSFRGDPKRPPRDESGTLITKEKYVEEVFLDALDLLQTGYEHPSSRVAPSLAQRS